MKRKNIPSILKIKDYTVIFTNFYECCSPVGVNIPGFRHHLSKQKNISPHYISKALEEMMKAGLMKENSDKKGFLTERGKQVVYDLLH